MPSTDAEIYHLFYPLKSAAFLKVLTRWNSKDMLSLVVVRETLQWYDLHVYPSNASLFFQVSVQFFLKSKLINVCFETANACSAQVSFPFKSWQW